MQNAKVLALPHLSMSWHLRNAWAKREQRQIDAAEQDIGYQEEGSDGDQCGPKWSWASRSRTAWIKKFSGGGVESPLRYVGYFTQQFFVRGTNAEFFAIAAHQAARLTVDNLIVLLDGNL